MKIRRSRLLKQLSVLGYSHLAADGASDFSLVRTIPGQPVSEWIEVGWSGRKGEAVYAWAGVAVTKYVATKGLIELRALREIGKVKERGWTIVETAEAALEWEESLVRVAPPIVTALVADQGPELLRRTEAARTAAGRYLARVPQSGTVEDRLAALKGSASSRMIAEAERLAEGPGVLQVPDGEDTYLLACLAISLWSGEVEGNGSSFFGEIPIDNQELMWRIQLVADELLFDAHHPVRA